MPLTDTQPRVYYEERGDGDPLLAISGFAVSSAVLEPMAALYGSRLRFITCDYPGAGRSEKTFACTTAQLAAGAVRVLDELEIESAHVAGLSLGGAVAQELAIRFPHRVRGLILIGTSTAGPLSAPPDVLRLVPLVASMARGSVQRRRVWLGPVFFSRDYLEREPDAADAMLATLSEHPTALRGIFAQLLAAGLHDRAFDLHRIRAPTLVLQGENDYFVPMANARRLAEGIPDAELRVFPGAGHGFALEQLEETFSIICEWLERRRPVAADAPSRAATSAERLTRQLAVPLGGLRVGRSSVVLAGRALTRLSRRLPARGAP
jgi:pimeloyl-ACP methyl ester carboxylesterase